MAMLPLSGTSDKIPVNCQHPFVSCSNIFLMNDRAKLLRSWQNNFYHELVSGHTRDMDKCLRFDFGDVVETTPKELTFSYPDNIESGSQSQTP